MFYFYILRSKKDAKLYIGSTNNLRKRFYEHNSRKVFSIRWRAPFNLVYYEAYLAEKDAIDREHNIKLRANALTQLKRRLKYSLTQ
ncbi:MAG: GIY-YIG nuclease family protein [Candidatus Sungbacteria bacterium]|nr:GIY-YIG nuclease family protein [Candidatus Sungbacteria bacterium]